MAGIGGGGVVVGCVGGVGLVFCLYWSRQSWVLAVVRSGYLRTNAYVISGKEDRKPTSIVSHSINITGKHIAPCRNAMRLVMVAYGV